MTEVASRLGTGAHIGGGVRVIPERRSAGICATYAVMEAVSAITRLGGGVFWCFRGDFDAVGGFDENRELAEDLDFARRLRRRGRQTRRRFTNLRRTPVVASCRKFDRFGDWHMFHMPLEARQIYAATRRTDPAWVDRYFYDFND